MLSRRNTTLIVLTVIIIAVGLIDFSEPTKVEIINDVETITPNDIELAPTDSVKEENWSQNIKSIDLKILVREGCTNNIQLKLVGNGTVDFWFQIKITPDEDPRYSTPIPAIRVQNNRTITICFINESSDIWKNNALPIMIIDSVYLVDP